MRRQVLVLRRRIKVSVVMLGAALVCLVLAGCSAGPVKMGSAAIVGDQRITIATLDTEVTSLSQAVKQYPGIVQLSQQQQTQETLTWLVRFQINEELARQAGITVTTAQANLALAQIYAAAKSEAAAQGITNASLNLIMTANGIPPNLSDELGRYQAINNQFVRQVNGGKVPATTAQQTATSAKLQHAQCVAAKNLNIQINPQFGRMDYAQYQVVSASGTVFRTPGPAPSPSQSGLAPAC
jgi:SurA-like N-terminal domain